MRDLLTTGRSSFQRVLHLGDRPVVLSLLGGLFLSRVGAELLSPAQATLAAMIGLAGGFVLTWWAIARRPQARWLILLLLPAVIFPYPSPQLGLLCGLWVAAAWSASAPPTAGRWPLDLAMFGAALLLFGLTLAPGVQPADAGEFQLVLGTFGIAHPPGYPLYTVTGGLFVHLLPLGSLADRANLFSALSAALTLALLGRTVRIETRSAWAGLVAAGVLGAAAAFWTTATQASIRPFMALFTILLIAAALAYRRALREDDPRCARNALIAFGLAGGLGITHHASLIFVGAVLALALLAADPSLIRRPRRWLPGVAAALVGILPWLYLPLRAQAGATLAPASLTTWDGFWAHVLARGFAGDLFYYNTLPAIVPRLGLMGQVLALQWQAVILILAAGAAMLAAWRDRWLLLALGGAFSLHTLVTATYHAPQTVEYMIPAYVCLAALTGWAVAALRPLHGGRWLSAFAVGAAVVGIVGSAWPTWISLRAYQQRDPTQQAAQAVLESAPPDAIILTNWHHTTPLWTLQQLAGLRPDVDVRYVAPGQEPILETWAQLIEAAPKSPSTLTCSYYPEVFRNTGRAFSALATCWRIGSARDDPAAAEPIATYPDLALSRGAWPASSRAGESLDVVLNWSLATPLDYGALTTFVHVLDTNGNVVAQVDLPLPASPSSTGQIAQRYRLHLPRTLLPDEYRLAAGIYTTASGVPLLDGEGRERIEFGTFIAEAASLPPVTGHEESIPVGDALRLRGYDYDLSVLGRARLYVHWQVVQTQNALVDLQVHAGEALLAANELPLDSPGFVTTAFDLPDTATLNGLTLTVMAGTERLPVYGAWGLAVAEPITLPPPQTGDRYVMLGDVVLTGFEARLDPATGDLALDLTLRALAPIVQDMSLKLAAGADVLVEGTPADGTLPTLKWGWAATIHETAHVTLAADQLPTPDLSLTFYDAFTSEVWPIFDPALAQSGPGLQLSLP